MLQSEEIKKKIREFFKQYRDAIDVVYLFGSIVSANFRSTSDVDIALLYKAHIPKPERFNLRLDMTGELEGLTGRKIDIVDMQEAPILLVRQIMKEKVILLEFDAARRVNFEVKSRREYFDMQYYLDLHTDKVLEDI